MHKIAKLAVIFLALLTAHGTGFRRRRQQGRYLFFHFCYGRPWILVLVYMAGKREHILRYGKIIYLRTAPIDLRDLFRGDHVRLNYEISSIPANSLPQKDGFQPPIPVSHCNRSMVMSSFCSPGRDKSSNLFYPMKGALSRPKTQVRSKSAPWTGPNGSD